MAATGLFIGATEDWLLATKQSAMNRYSKGTVIVSYADSGSSVNKQLTAPVKDVIAECNLALWTLDPVKYSMLGSRSVFGSSYDTRTL
jgi:hypothetical protein